MGYPVLSISVGYALELGLFIVRHVRFEEKRGQGCVLLRLCADERCDAGPSALPPPQFYSAEPESTVAVRVLARRAMHLRSVAKLTRALTVSHV